MDLLEHKIKKACNSVVECLPHEQHCRWFNPNQAYISEKNLFDLTPYSIEVLSSSTPGSYY